MACLALKIHKFCFLVLKIIPWWSLQWLNLWHWVGNGGKSLHYKRNKKMCEKLKWNVGEKADMVEDQIIIAGVVFFFLQENQVTNNFREKLFFSWHYCSECYRNILNPCFLILCMDFYFSCSLSTILCYRPNQHGWGCSKPLETYLLWVNPCVLAMFPLRMLYT